MARAALNNRAIDDVRYNVAAKRDDACLLFGG